MVAPVTLTTDGLGICHFEWVQMVGLGICHFEWVQMDICVGLIKKCWRFGNWKVILCINGLFCFCFSQRKSGFENRIVCRVWMMKEWSLQQSTYFRILWSSVRPWCESSSCRKHRLRMMWVCVIALGFFDAILMMLLKKHTTRWCN